MSTELGFAPLRYPVLRDAELEAATERARVQGHSAGYAQGLRAAAAEAELLREQLRTESDAAIAEYRAAAALRLETVEHAARVYAAAVMPVLAESEEALVEASIALAEAIIGRELEDTKGSARAALARAVEATEPEEISEIRLHPDDIAALKGLAPKGLHLVADPTLSRGDAIVGLPHGYLDARIATALDRARAALRGVEA